MADIDALGRDPDLTRAQAQALVFIFDFMAEIGRAPTIREIIGGCDISSTSHVSFTLDRLEKKGWIFMSGERHDTRRVAVVGAEYVLPGLPDEVKERAKIQRKSDQELHDIAELAERLGFKLE